MKRIALVLGVLLIIFLSVQIYCFARNKIILPRPEDMAGREASAFLPRQVENGAPAAKGSTELKLTGPVWVEK